MNEGENKWSCSKCTYDNYQVSNKCSVCLHPRRSEVIQLPPVRCERPLVIKNLQSSPVKDRHSDLIICPPGCSKKNVELTNVATNSSSVTDNDDFLLKKYDGHPVESSDHLCLKTDSTDKPWSCGTCTFINRPNNAWCSQCRNSKQNLSPKGATASCLIDKASPSLAENKNNKNQKWTCLICTYDNWKASRKCVMCHQDKDAVANASKINAHTIEVAQDTIETDVASSSGNTIDRTNKSTLADAKQLSNSKYDHDITSQTLFDKNVLDDKEQLEISAHVTDGLLSITSRSRSSSSSSCSSHSSRDDANSSNQSRSSKQRRINIDNQACSSVNGACSSQRNGSSGCKLPRSNSSSHLYSPGRLEIIDNRSFKNRARNLNWLFLKACIGVVDGNAEAVDAYLAHGGNIARSLTLDEINSLNRPSAFDVGHTLVHLAIRFQRHNILALLLNPEIAPRGFKRNPAHLSPDVADLIRREIMMSLRTRKGDFHCRFLSECSTFQLPIEICDLPSSIQQLLFNELLDQDVQKELEEESAINWSPSLLRIGDCNNRLYSLWNRSAGDCLLDSVLQATWGVFDRDNVLRTAMSESLQDCATSFFKRWRDWELYQANLIGFSLTERQCLQDWAFIHTLAQQPGASLEHCHIFVLSHILRRPIIIYGIKYLKSFRGETLGFAKFQGVYLPFLWDQSFCYTSPIALGYTRGHFTALVTMENDAKDIRAGARHRNHFNTVKHLPLVDSDGKILPIHFTARGEDKNDEQRKEILQEWLDCHVTEDGLLVAKQRPGKRPPSVTRLVDGWLDHYRHMSFRRLGEEGDSDEDEE